MKPISSFVVAVVLALSFGTACGAATTIVRQPETVPAGKVLTLDDCIDLALKNEPSIRQAAAQVQGQIGAVEQSKSNLLPSADVGTSTVIDSNTRGKGTSLTLGASQLIYDFGRSTSKVTSATRILGADRENLTAAQADVVLNVKTAYYTMLRAQHLVDVFAENLKSQEEHVAEAQARRDVGLAPNSDVLNAQAAAASAKVDLVSAQNAADQARVDLNTAMGIEISSPTQIAEGSEPETPVPALDEAIRLALTRRPEIFANTLQVRAAEASVTTARTDDLPSVTTSFSKNQRISGSGSTGNSGQTGSGSSSSWSWMLNMSWPIFDSGFTKGAVKQAKAQVVSSQETLYTTRQSVSRDVVQARLNLISANEQLASAIAEVTSAKENLDAATGRYKAQVGIFLEVVDAQASYLKAQTDEFSARYALSIARAALQHATGGIVLRGRS